MPVFMYVYILVSKSIHYTCMTNTGLKALLSISKVDLKKDLKQILNDILTLVGGAMDAHSGSIMLVNEETGELEMVATFGLPDDYIERIYSKGVPITSSPSGEALKTGHYYQVSNIFEEPRDKPWMDISRELGFSSQLYMPMKRKDEVIGLLNIYMANPHEFMESEIAFLTIAASQAAAVIENARLYGKIRNKNVELKHEIIERTLAEEEIRKLSSAVEQSIDGIAIGDLEPKLTYVNDAFARMHGYSSEEMIGLKVVNIHNEEQMDEYKSGINQIKTQGGWVGEIEHIRKDGTPFPTCMSVTLLKGVDGKPTGILATTRDITERKKAEEQIKASLREKEVLLKEIHHRVKNNLQVVLSLLTMQIRATKNKDAIDILNDSRNRINAIALIHSQLYESGNLSEINMKRFMDKLMVQLHHIHLVPETRISPVVHVAESSFPISIAVPLGLIANELLINAFKYAFVNRKAGKIEVSLRASEKGVANLTVSDDGVGLSEGFDVNANETLGLSIVKLLAEDQLDGKLEVVSKEGTTFKVEFKMAEE